MQTQMRDQHRKGRTALAHMIMEPSSAGVAIVRYGNDVSSLVASLEERGFAVKVYEKHPDNHDKPCFVPVNKGNEASGYLKYIVDHYSSLPAHVVLLHDHEFSWHHEGSIVDRVMENVGKRVSYRNLNSFTWNSKTIEWFPALADWYDIYLRGELGPLGQYGDFMTGHQGCAQFIVHRDVIRKRSLAFYTQLYRWLLETGLASYYSARYLEYTWHLMWEQVPKWNYSKQAFVRRARRMLGAPVARSAILDGADTPRG